MRLCLYFIGRTVCRVLCKNKVFGLSHRQSMGPLFQQYPVISRSTRIVVNVFDQVEQRGWLDDIEITVQFSAMLLV